MLSVYTKDDLKAYKSLDAYKYLLAGWVGDLSIHIIEDKIKKCRKFIICAKVLTATHGSSRVAFTDWECQT